MIGGYFLGPSASGQAVFYFSNRSEQVDVAKYLNALWKGRRARSPSIKEIHAVFEYWRPAAIVVVASPRSPAVRVLTQLFGRPASHVGEVFSWRLALLRLLARSSDGQSLKRVPRANLLGHAIAAPISRRV
jgi:hypothetical protein